MKAFHGTSENNVNSIQNDGFNVDRDSGRLPNDLGDGYYFFVKNTFGLSPEKMAFQYAKTYQRSPVAVLSVNVDEKNSNVLNCDCLSTIEEVVKFRLENYEAVKEQLTYYKTVSSPQKGILKRGNLDGIILNMMIEKLESVTGVAIDVIKKNTYTKCECPGYNLSNFPNGTEICIRNSQKITNIQKASIHN